MRTGNDRGFIMVALLVGMAVTAIWMTAALPAWRQQVQRQREEDLIFRGEQYARAIVLFQDKNRGALPPSIDILVSGHYLRKKWKDPITNDEFVPLGSGIAAPGAQQPDQVQEPGRRRAVPANRPRNRRLDEAIRRLEIRTRTNRPLSRPGFPACAARVQATSIKIYQQQQQYSLWPFDAALIRARMGRQIQQQNPQQPGRNGQPGRGGDNAGPGRGGAPGRGGPGGGPGRGGPGGGPIGPGGPGQGGGPVTLPGRGGGS